MNGVKRRSFGILLAVFYFSAFALMAFIVGRSIISDRSAYAYEAAEATETLSIESIGLLAPVRPLALINHKLETPERIAGAYAAAENKTFLIGHNTTIFENLKNVKLGDQITYVNKTYTVKNIEELEKSAIDMSELLKSEDAPTLVLMTCAGERLSANDFTKRLIITAF